MSSNSFIWVTEGGDLSTADWGCLAGRCISRLHVVAVRLAARFSDDKHIRGVVREMRYTNWHLYLFYATQFMITYVQQHLKRSNRRSNKQNVISIKQYSHTNIPDVATKRTVSDFVNKTINIYRKKIRRQPPLSNSTRQSNKPRECATPFYTRSTNRKPIWRNKDIY